MKQLPLKPKINRAILNFLEPFKVGDQLRSESVIKYCHKHIHRYIYGDTILRYMRQLRERGMINYTCISKSERIIKIIAQGEAHSL